MAKPTGTKKIVKPKPKLKSKRVSQNFILDRCSSGSLNATTLAGTALSLRPDHHISHAVAAGSRLAAEIIAAWRFKFSVVEMTPAELELSQHEVVYFG